MTESQTKSVRLKSLLAPYTHPIPISSQSNYKIGTSLQTTHSNEQANIVEIRHKKKSRFQSENFLLKRKVNN